MDALTPSRAFYLQDLSGSYDVTSAKTVVRPSGPSPSVAPLISRFNTSTVCVHATAQLLFLSTISPLKCCEKL